MGIVSERLDLSIRFAGIVVVKLLGGKTLGETGQNAFAARAWRASNSNLLSLPRKLTSGSSESSHGLPGGITAVPFVRRRCRVVVRLGTAGGFRPFCVGCNCCG